MTLAIRMQSLGRGLSPLSPRGGGWEGDAGDARVKHSGSETGNQTPGTVGQLERKRSPGLSSEGWAVSTNHGGPQAQERPVLCRGPWGFFLWQQPTTPTGDTQPTGTRLMFRPSHLPLGSYTIFRVGTGAVAQQIWPWLGCPLPTHPAGPGSSPGRSTSCHGAWKTAKDGSSA